MDRLKIFLLIGLMCGVTPTANAVAISYAYPNTPSGSFTLFTPPGPLNASDPDSLTFFQSSGTTISSALNPIASTSGTGTIAILGNGSTTWTVNNSASSAGGVVDSFTLNHSGNFTFPSNVILNNTNSSSTTGSSSYGINVNSNESSASTLTNNGSINAFGSATGAGSQVIGIQANLGMNVNNAGTITATSTGGAVLSGGVNSTGTGATSITNSGTISASNTSGPAYGIQITNNVHTVSNTGTGVITGTSSSGAGVGIFITSTSGLTINNTGGTITGSTNALQATSSSNIALLLNGGTLSGAVVSMNSIEFQTSSTMVNGNITGTPTFQVDSGATGVMNGTLASTSFTLNGTGTAIFQETFAQASVGTFTMGASSILAFDSNTSSISGALTGGGSGTVVFGQATATTNFTLSTVISNFPNVKINPGSTVTVNSPGNINVPTLTNLGTLAVTTTISSTSVDNKSGGTINLTSGANVTNQITNEPGATIFVSNSSPGGTTVGTIVGTSSTTAGTVNVDTNGTLAVTTYTNPGIHKTNIASAVSFGQVNATTANLNNATINVTASVPQTTAGPWPIITGVGASSVSATGTTYNLPSTGQVLKKYVAGLNTNDSAIVVNIINLTFFQAALGSGAGTFALNVAQALDYMNAIIANSGQSALLSYFKQVITGAQLVNGLNQMVPNVSVNTTNLTMQNSLMNKTEARVTAGRRRKKAAGISSGDLTCDTAFWIGSFGNVAKQKQNAQGVNTGYHLRALGSIIGIDANLPPCMLGFALAFANASTYESSNVNFNTHTMSYYALLYGSYYSGNFFNEWILAAGTNSNAGTRGINIVGNNLLVNSKFYGFQGGLKLNIGNYTDWDNGLRFAHIVSIQYSYLHQLAYNESGSVAALNVRPEPNQNILTLGTGLRFSLPGCDPWLTGSRELRALVTYDVIHPQQTTFANFLVGSPNFSITNAAPARLAAQVGADFSLTFFDNFQLQLSYDYQWRSGYYDNIGEVLIRYFF